MKHGKININITLDWITEFQILSYYIRFHSNLIHLTPNQDAEGEECRNFLPSHCLGNANSIYGGQISRIEAFRRVVWKTFVWISETFPNILSNCLIHFIRIKWLTTSECKQLKLRRMWTISKLKKKKKLSKIIFWKEIRWHTLIHDLLTAGAFMFTFRHFDDV